MSDELRAFHTFTQNSKFNTQNAPTAWYNSPMCGIAGNYNKDGAPVGDGFYYGEGVGLAHLALRIIDLSDAARQPMSNEDGRLRLIFNGEIYNYRELRPDLEARGHHFRSQSDSENILHAYEEWG